MPQRDIFRRQYLLGPRTPTTRAWQSRPFADNFLLSPHPEIPVNQCRASQRHLVVLGDILDPQYPDKTNQQVLDSLFEAFASYAALEQATCRMAGRWILFAALESERRAYPDATGSRPIYFSNVDGELWIGSLPSILAQELGYLPDHRLVLELAATESGDWWPGAITPFAQIRHSGPNHYFDLCRGTPVRFWPVAPIPTCTVDSAAREIGRLLSGSIRAAANRYQLYLAVTGGYDSRVLISSSKEIHDQITFFTLAYPGIHHYDLNTPARLAEALDLNYSVERFEASDESFLNQFDHLAANMVRGQCRLNTTSYSRFPDHALFVEGTGSEVIRCFYYSNGRHPDVLNSMDLSRRAGFGELPAAFEAFEAWLDTVPRNIGINTLDLFYWEQRMGNWNAIDYQTQEAVRRVFSPFNCRQLLVAGLGTPVEARRAPYQMHRTICKQLLPETMRLGFNSSRRDRVSSSFRRVIRLASTLLGRTRKRSR